MPKFLVCPKSFDEAEQMMQRETPEKIPQKSRYFLQSVAGVGGEVCAAIALCDDRRTPLVTHHADGRIKICTHGRKEHSVLLAINACLPDPYCIRRRGTHCALFDKSQSKTVATFLSSTIFKPDPAAEAVSEGAA